MRDKMQNAENSVLLLKVGEVCEMSGCLFEKHQGVDDNRCYGKKLGRDNQFSCDIEDLKATYKRGEKRKMLETANRISERGSKK